MTTPISHNTPPSLPPTAGANGSATGPTASGSAATGQAGAGAPQADQVKLTDSALALQNASRTGDDGVVDQQKVEQIRAAIADGSYRIDPARIAGKMLELEQQLAGIGQG